MLIAFSTKGHRMTARKDGQTSRATFPANWRQPGAGRKVITAR